MKHLKTFKSMISYYFYYLIIFNYNILLIYYLFDINLLYNYLI
jgi:hypothetical protein